MANLRIISSNATNRALSIVASTTAGSLIADNLRTDIKAQVWRSVGTTASLTVTWPSAEWIGCVALPFCNLTSTSTIRVRGYATAASTVALVDTGVVSAIPYAAFGMFEWGIAELGETAYSHGGGAYANVWITPTLCEKIVIDIVDADNTDGYIEAARLVTGAYWSPTFNADYGASISMDDRSKHVRTDGGDLITDIGTASRKISVNFSAMPEADRAKLMGIIRGNGLPTPVYFSLYPACGNPVLEQTYQLYCKQSSLSAISAPYYNAFSSSLELEEM